MTTAVSNLWGKVCNNKFADDLVSPLELLVIFTIERYPHTFAF